MPPRRKLRIGWREATSDRGATILDYLGDSPARRSWSRSRTTSRAAIVKLREQIDASYAEAIRKNAARRGARVAGHRLGRCRGVRSTRRRRSRRSRSAPKTRVRHIACQPALEFSAAFRTGSPSCATARAARRDGGVRRRTRRAAPSARSSCSPTTRCRPRRSTAAKTRTRRPCSWRPAISRRDSGCRAPRCSSAPRPMSSRKSADATSGGDRRRGRSSPISAISRSAISSSTSTTASACSSA